MAMEQSLDTPKRILEQNPKITRRLFRLIQARLGRKRKELIGASGITRRALDPRAEVPSTAYVNRGQGAKTEQAGISDRARLKITIPRLQLKADEGTFFRTGEGRA